MIFLTFQFQDLILILRVLRDWYPTEFEQRPELPQIAGMFLRDLYVRPQIVLDHRPKVT